MTVSYTREVSTSRGFGCFLKLLLRWKASIYKLVWPNLIVYISLYYAINLTYRFALSGQQQTTFRQIVEYCSTFGTLIPLSFILGLFVNFVLSRWWNQYTTIPYPDNLALLVSASVRGDDERSRIIRRTIVRYACLCFTVTLSLISSKVKRRFPTPKHLVEAGLLMDDERKIMQSLKEKFPKYPQFWLPLAWAANITTKARQEGLIRNDLAVTGILQQICDLRTRCGTLIDFDWISVPLIYTQVITIAVYTYFAVSIVGKQQVQDSIHLDVYFPFLGVLEFFFYMGWLRVAETLINPFGEDDDDFDVVWMIDRHVQVTYLIADKMHEEHPKLMHDQYWTDLAPQQLPFTHGSEKYIDDCPQSSTDNLSVTEEEAEIIPAGVRNIMRGNSLQQVLSAGSRKSSQNSSMTRKPKLQSVSVEDNKDIINEQTPEPQLFEIFNRKDTVDTETTAGDKATFDNLKKVRQQVLKQKVVNYMKLVKQNSIEETEAIVDDIINIST